MAINQRDLPVISKIAIIGAGVSGLAAAKQLRHHNPVVFEAKDSIGGVWKGCSYNSTKLQSTRRDYEFTDFPWPNRDDRSFASHVEILDYLESYAEHFDVLKHVRFNSKVVGIRSIGDQKSTDFDGKPGEYASILPGDPVWEVAVQINNLQYSIKSYAFEFVVVCTGRYGDIPRIPVFPRNKGPETFQGQVLHTILYCKLDKEAASQLLRGKKVVVVGYKKSAFDLAMECVEANQGAVGQPCTMVVRTPHWSVPHCWVWDLPPFISYAKKFSQLLYRRPNQTLLRTLFCLLFSPVRHGVCKFIESYLLWKLPLLKYGLKPDHPMEEDYASCQMSVIPEGFFSEADKGKIVFKRASKWWFWEGGLEFEDNTRVEADVVILATGYEGKKKLTAILPEPFRSLLEYPSGLIPLYRGTIHPLIPNMAFVGYIEHLSNLHTSELRSIWLARLVDNKFKLPSVEEMLEQISKEMEVMRQSSRFYKRHCTSTFSINYSNEICEEMGWNTLRKKNWLLEAFSPYSNLGNKEDK